MFFSSKKKKEKSYIPKKGQELPFRGRPSLKLLMKREISILSSKKYESRRFKTHTTIIRNQIPNVQYKRASYDFQDDKACGNKSF